MENIASKVIADTANSEKIFCKFLSANDTSETGRVRDGIDLPEFTVNILKPLYPNSEKTKKENVRDLKNGAFDACMKKYEQAYGAE